MLFGYIVRYGSTNVTNIGWPQYSSSLKWLCWKVFYGYYIQMAFDTTPWANMAILFSGAGKKPNLIYNFNNRYNKKWLYWFAVSEWKQTFSVFFFFALRLHLCYWKTLLQFNLFSLKRILIMSMCMSQHKKRNDSIIFFLDLFFFSLSFQTHTSLGPLCIFFFCIDFTIWFFFMEKVYIFPVLLL